MNHRFPPRHGGASSLRSPLMAAVAAAPSGVPVVADLEPRGGPTLWLRQQLRGSPDVPLQVSADVPCHGLSDALSLPLFPLTRCCSCRPWQSFAYNPIHRQFLSIDVDGGRRLWSLKGEVLYETWKEVAQDDPDLHRYVTARVLALPSCLSAHRSCMIASYRFGGTWSPEALSVMVWSPPPHQLQQAAGCGAAALSAERGVLLRHIPLPRLDQEVRKRRPCRKISHRNLVMQATAP